MFRKKLNLPLILGGLIAIFIVIPFFEWLGLPSFANVLYFLFGEPEGRNRIGAALFTLFIIILIFLGMYLRQRKSTR